MTVVIRRRLFAFFGEDECNGDITPTIKRDGAKLSSVARIWKERLNPLGTSTLAPREVILVRVASFTFRFSTTRQLRECIQYYEQKTHASSRIPAKVLAADLGSDWRKFRGWDVERWFERLPMYLLEEPKRQKVLKALHKTLALIEAGKL